MSTFTRHSIDSAPADSKPLLLAAFERHGFIPNVYAYMAEAPITLEALRELAAIFGRSTFTKEEQHVILLTASVENRCTFCVAAHTMGAQASGVPQHEIASIRNGAAVQNSRDQALVTFVRAVIRERGFVKEYETQDFFDSGFSQRQALEVIVGVTLKILTNYINHMTHTELNAEITAHSWEVPAAERKAGA